MALLGLPPVLARGNRPNTVKTGSRLAPVLSAYGRATEHELKVIVEATIHVRVTESDRFSGVMLRVTKKGDVGIVDSPRERSRPITRIFPTWERFILWLGRESDYWAIQIHSGKPER